MHRSAPFRWLPRLCAHYLDRRLSLDGNHKGDWVTGKDEWERTVREFAARTAQIRDAGH
jgi:hypothetical protein